MFLSREFSIIEHAQTMMEWADLLCHNAPQSLWHQKHLYKWQYQMQWPKSKKDNPSDCTSINHIEFTDQQENKD